MLDQSSDPVAKLRCGLEANFYRYGLAALWHNGLFVIFVTVGSPSLEVYLVYI